MRKNVAIVALLTSVLLPIYFQFFRKSYKIRGNLWGVGFETGSELWAKVAFINVGNADAIATMERSTFY